MRCSINSCEGKAIARGWCHKHYKRWQVHGDPLVNLAARTLEERFWDYVDKGGDGGCWLWTGPTNKRGYARISEGPRGNKRDIPAARFAYKLVVGPPPEDLSAHHACGVVRCVNPAHLEFISGADVSRRHYAAMDRCKHGHPYDAENTYVRRDNGRRMCKQCGRDTRQRNMSTFLAWRDRNADRMRGYTRAYKGRKLGAAGTCSVEQLAARVAYYGDRCYLCGGPWQEIDHVIPLIRGGSNWPANLRPICGNCNRVKGGRPLQSLAAASRAEAEMAKWEPSEVRSA